jgi:AAA-like domain
VICQPITFAYRNLVFGRDATDAWALYRIQTTSFDGLTVAAKKELLGTLAAFCYQVTADFQLLRVSKAWSIEDYLDGARALLDPRHGHERGWNDYLTGHRATLTERAVAQPEVYLAVRLASPELPLTRKVASAAGEGLKSLLEVARELIAARDARGLTHRQLQLLLGDEERTFQRAIDYLDCDRASTGELEWLVRRCFCRSLGEPGLDERFAPQALVIADERDEARYVPLERDLLRLMDSPIERGARELCVHCELGRSHQALLCLGALPETAPFPGRQSELLFSPLEALGFPVDAALTCRFVANAQAVALVRKKIVDADNTFVEESHGDHGPSSASAYRPQAARELEDYLTAGARPPLLRSAISLAVAAPTPELLEERVERVRREYAPVALHRPLGDQLELFCQHLPAQRTRVEAYEDYLTVDQVGAMVPTAAHAVGSAAGPYLGHTLSGSQQPVLFDLTEASRGSRPPSILMAGTLGSGKTLAMELLLYQAFLQGSLVVDVDPKGAGDHKLAALPGVASHLEAIELSADRRFAGMLDPLRIAPAELREDLAVSWLIGVLPEPVAPPWRREIIAAVRQVNERAAAGGREPTCVEVIELLLEGEADAHEAGRTLQIYADTGLARLGFSDPAKPPPAAGSKQVTMLGIRNLARPLPGAPKADYTEEERIGQATLRLLAAYAMRLVGGDPSRHAVLGFDEAWVLLSDSTGRRLIEVLNRMGRSLNVTPILASQTITESQELDNLLGARFVFGMESEREAARGLELLGLDPEDRDLLDQLTRFRAGRCFMRDYHGRVARTQIDFVDPNLLAALDTTPMRTPPPPSATPRQQEPAAFDGARDPQPA